MKSILALAVATSCALWPGFSWAQDATQLTGTWKLVGWQTKFDGGDAVEPYGPTPKGRLVLTALVNEGFAAVTILDLSKNSLAIARTRFGSFGEKAQWVVADVTTWEPSETYDVWHDRAAFHFLTEPRDRVAYAERVSRVVRPGGHVIIGTFAPDGPERCSGLQVVRHDAASVSEMLGSEFPLMESRPHVHQTPWGATQRFQFSRFRRAK